MPLFILKMSMNW